jgi:hypothetical protein
MRKLIYIRKDEYFFNRLLDFKFTYDVDYTTLVSINKLNKKDKYVYVKYFRGHPFLDAERKLSEHDRLLWSKMKKFDIKLIYVSDNESGSVDSIKWFETWLTDKGVDLSKIILINNNRWIKKLESNENKIQVDSFERIVWEGVKCVMNNKDPNFDKDSKKKIFQCYNRAINAYRTCVIVDLIKQNLIDEVDWSHLRRPFYLDSIPEKGLPTIYEIITGNRFETIENIYNDLVTKYPKKSEFESHYEFEDENGSIDYNIYYNENPYKFSYINIVNESKFDEYDNYHMHITEKTLLPFYYFQLPLFFANWNHVKFVEDNYGLDMFRDFINHDYDSEKDFQKRYKMLFIEINRLYKMKNEISDFYVKNKERFEANHDIIEKLIGLKNNDVKKVKNIFEL